MILSTTQLNTSFLKSFSKQLSPDHEVWESINTFRWGARDRDSGDSSRRVSSSSSPANGLDIDGEGGGGGEGGSDCNYEAFNELVPSTGQGSSSSSSSSSSRRVSSLPSLSHDLDIISAAGFPPHSNYTRDFKDVLDYIYIEPKHFKVVRVAPFPSEEVLSRNTALPSCAFPSDHLAVIVDLEFVD